MRNVFRITLNAVRFLAGVVVFVLRCPLAVAAGLVAWIDWSIDACFKFVDNTGESSFGSDLLAACMVGIATINAVTSGAVKMICSACSNIASIFRGE